MKLRHRAALWLLFTWGFCGPACHRHVEERRDATLQVRDVEQVHASEEIDAGVTLTEHKASLALEFDPPLPDGGTVADPPGVPRLPAHGALRKATVSTDDLAIVAALQAKGYADEAREHDVDAGQHEGKKKDSEPELPKVPVSCAFAGWWWIAAVAAGAALAFRLWRRS